MHIIVMDKKVIRNGRVHGKKLIILDLVSGTSNVVRKNMIAKAQDKIDTSWRCMATERFSAFAFVRRFLGLKLIGRR